MGKSVVRFGDADVPHCSGMTRLGKSSNVFANGKGVGRTQDVLNNGCTACGAGSLNVFAGG